MDSLKDITPAKMNEINCEENNSGTVEKLSQNKITMSSKKKLFDSDSALQPVLMCDLPGVKEMFKNKNEPVIKIEKKTINLEPVPLCHDPVITKLREALNRSINKANSTRKSTVVPTNSSRKQVATKLYDKFQPSSTVKKKVSNPPPPSRKSYLPPKSKISVMNKPSTIQKIPENKTPLKKLQKENFVKPSISKNIFSRNVALKNTSKILKTTPNDEIVSNNGLEELRNILLEIKNKINKLETNVDRICHVLSITKDDGTCNRLNYLKNNDEMLDGICEMENTVISIEIDDESENNSLEIKSNLNDTKQNEIVNNLTDSKQNKTLTNSTDSEQKKIINNLKKKNIASTGHNNSLSNSVSKIYKIDEGMMEKENVDPEVSEIHSLKNVVKSLDFNKLGQNITPEKSKNTPHNNDLKIKNLQIVDDLRFNNNTLKNNLPQPKTVEDDINNFKCLENSTIQKIISDDTSNFDYSNNDIKNTKIEKIENNENSTTVDSRDTNNFYEAIKNEEQKVDSENVNNFPYLNFSIKNNITHNIDIDGMNNKNFEDVMIDNTSQKTGTIDEIPEEHTKFNNDSTENNSTPQNINDISEEFELLLQTPLPNIEETLRNVLGANFTSSHQKSEFYNTPQTTDCRKSLFKNETLQSTENFKILFQTPLLNIEETSFNVMNRQHCNKSSSLDELSISKLEETESKMHQSTPDIVRKTLNSYNALRNDNFLCTPKVNYQSPGALMTPSVELSKKKLISRKIQQQLFMLNKN